jgi:hypothetical protein
VGLCSAALDSNKLMLAFTTSLFNFHLYNNQSMCVEFSLCLFDGDDDVGHDKDDDHGVVIGPVCCWLVVKYLLLIQNAVSRLKF